MKLVNKQRRLISLGLVLLPTLSFAATEKPVITMWKSPTCGCCKDWADHIERNGFVVKTYTDGNDEIRKKLGMPIQFGSCHTALIDGYAIEGLAIPNVAVWKGDQVVTAISAASIIAKVTRDRMMVELDAIYPQYGFAQHKGYITAAHTAALHAHGPCVEHRKSFSNIASLLR